MLHVIEFENGQFEEIPTLIPSLQLKKVLSLNVVETKTLKYTRNFTTKTGEQKECISTATNVEVGTDCSDFVSLVNQKKLMVIVNGMKLTRLVIKDYNTQTNDHIVKLIRSNKFRGYDVFLRCHVKEGDEAISI